MSNDEPVRLALEPLVRVLEVSRALRLVARPGSVMLDAMGGSAPAAVAWDEAQHAAALAAAGQSAVRFTSGVTASALGYVLVVRAPPRSDRRIDDLVREGLVSSLAARTLAAALALGRNVLVAGPWAAAVPLVAALAAEGKRPCVVGVAGDAVPPSWPLLASSAEAAAYGADRIAAWSLPATRVAALLRERSGAVAWIDARRLDHALVRFEAALDAGAAAPLHVLAALDLVTVVAGVPAARVSELAEITLVEEGYRPRLLFASGLPPVPVALVPVALPSFAGELTHGGFGVLADELRHAVPAASHAPMPSAGAAPPREPSAARGALVPSGRERGTTTGPRARLEAPDAPPPGWEIDRLAADPAPDGGATTSSDDASLAATYGLGPPPRPAGVRGFEARSFADALQHARERAEGEGEEEPT